MMERLDSYKDNKYLDFADFVFRLLAHPKYIYRRPLFCVDCGGRVFRGYKQHAELW